MKISQSDKRILLIVSVPVLQIFLFGPLQVLLNNFMAFPVHFSAVLGLGVLVYLLLTPILWSLLKLLRIPVLPALMTLLSVVVLLESRVFLAVSGMTSADGQPIDWSSFQWLSTIEIAVIVILAVLFLFVYRRLKLLASISLFVLLFNTVALVFMMVFSTDLVLGKTRPGMTGLSYYGKFYRLSNDRNVIHIVASQAQGAMLHEVFRSEADQYSGVFDGFTFFTQASGQFPATYPSVAYYMTGVSPQPDYDLTFMQPYTHEQIRETLRKDSLVNVLADDGFDTYGFQFYPQVFCQGRYTECTGSHDEVFAGIGARTPQKRLLLSVSTLFDVSLFQASPMLLKPKIYNDGLWLSSRWQYLDISHSGVLDLLTDKMRVSTAKPTYNYIHHAGAHAPVQFDRDCQYTGPKAPGFETQQEQLQCSLRQFGQLLQKLKDLNVYDQTMIVIHGDHGTPWLPAGFSARAGSLIKPEQLGLASTLLLIKPPESRGELQFSDLPVTIGDVPATIAAAMGVEHSFEGAQLFVDPLRQNRERVYFSYDANANVDALQALPNLARYRIRGDLFDEQSWLAPNAGFNTDRMSRIRMNHPEFSQYTEGFSHLEMHGEPSRWVDGKQARISLQAPKSRSMALVLECYVPPSIKGQSIVVSVNGIEIGRLDEDQLKSRRHIIPLPTELNSSEWLDIQLDMEKTLKSIQDTRQLSVLVSYIGIEPAG